jgi:hypothetical protein
MARALATRSEHVAAGMTEAAREDAVTRTARKARTERLARWIQDGRSGNGYMGRGTYGDSARRTAGYLRRDERLHIVR